MRSSSLSHTGRQSPYRVGPVPAMQAGFSAEFSRDNLIDRYARFALPLGVNAGQKDSAGALVRRGLSLAWQWIAGLVGQATEDKHLLAKPSQRLKRRRQGKTRALAGRRPMLHVHAVRRIYNRESFWRLAAELSGGKRREHRVDQRQCDRRPGGPEKCSTGQRFLQNNHPRIPSAFEMECCSQQP